MNIFWRAFQKNIVNISAAVIILFLILSLLRIREQAPDGSIRINELCSENLASLYDENGEHPDWIEIYNSSENEVDLSGWYLSDSESRLDKWEFPEGTTISANGYLTVYADSSKEPEPDYDESLSATNFIMTGKALTVRDNGKHLNFSLSGKGESVYLSDKNKVLWDSVEIPTLKYDTSWARIPDGRGTFSRRTTTPGESNEDSSEVKLPTLAEPVFSYESGFYEEEFELELKASEGETIRYTLDGSVPDENSPEYTEALRIKDRSAEDNIYSALSEISVELLSYINFRYKLPESPVDKCNIVRAAAFGADGQVSETVTKVFFVGFDKKEGYDGIGVISLVSDPEGLFDYEKGNFVIGKMGVESFREKLALSENALKYIEAHPETPTDGTVSINGVRMNEYLDFNYVQKGTSWEREAEITAFDENHEIEYDANVGIRVKGHRTRNFVKKSLNLYARDIYGTKSLAGLGGMEKSYSRASLFSGGNDMMTFLKDELATELFEGLEFASVGYSKPYHLFLDGEYWGIYRVGDKLGSEWLADIYGLDKENTAVVKNSLLADGGDGAAEVWAELQNFVRHADFGLDDDYEKVNAIMDMDSLMEYFAVRIFIDEGMDWPNTNTALWRAIGADGSAFGDGKWRWINFDNNANFDYSSISANTIAKARYGTNSYSRDELFAKLMENEQFRNDFYKKFLEISDTVFDPDKTVVKLDALAEELRPYVEKDYKRFFGDDYSVEDFDEKIDDMRKFLYERAQYIEEFVRIECEG